MVGASLVPATEAVKEARVLVAGEELESVTPRSDAISRCGGIVGGVFVFESVDAWRLWCRRRVRVLSPPVTEAVTE